MQGATSGTTQLIVDHSVKSDHVGLRQNDCMHLDIQTLSDMIISASKLQQHIRAVVSATESYELYNTRPTLRKLPDDPVPVTQRYMGHFTLYGSFQNCSLHLPKIHNKF